MVDSTFQIIYSLATFFLVVLPITKSGVRKSLLITGSSLDVLPSVLLEVFWGCHLGYGHLALLCPSDAVVLLSLEMIFYIFIITLPSFYMCFNSLPTSRIANIATPAFSSVLCNNYKLLWNQLLQNLLTQNDKHLSSHSSVGQARTKWQSWALLVNVSQEVPHSCWPR